MFENIKQQFVQSQVNEEIKKLAKKQVSLFPDGAMALGATLLIGVMIGQHTAPPTVLINLAVKGLGNLS